MAERTVARIPVASPLSAEELRLPPPPAEAVAPDAGDPTPPGPGPLWSRRV